jgi:hypothetical protein
MGIKSAIINVLSEVAYTPGAMAADLAAGAAEVLPWVGAGVGGGLVLMLAFLGIRKGFGFFKQVAK